MDGQQIFTLISLLAVLALWIGAFRDQEGWRRWMKRRREEAAEEAAPPPPERDHGGPWG